MLTRETAKVVIGPVRHYVGARLVRTQYQGGVQRRDDSEREIWCPHTHGHKTIDAAKRCGIAMWKRLGGADA